MEKKLIFLFLLLGLTSSLFVPGAQRQDIVVRRKEIIARGANGRELQAYERRRLPELSILRQKNLGRRIQMRLKGTALDDGQPVRSRLVPLFTFLSLWYFLNGAFNVQNKMILNQFPYPWIVSWFQLASGLLFVLPAWAFGARQKPKVDLGLLLTFAPIAALHCFGHGLQVSSMGAGSVFFTHVIKATEPVIGVIVLLLFTGTIAPWRVNACLLPIVAGVAYAALKPDSTAFDLSALWSYASIAALGSTIAFAIAKLLAKQLMTKDMKKQRNLDPANNYALLTCCSTALLFFPSLFGQGASALNAFSLMDDKAAFVRQLFSCGFFYYFYNELGFRVLNILSPVSASVANSLKRVVVLLAAVIFLGEKVGPNQIIGASIAMFGVLLYSIAKADYSKRKSKAVEQSPVTDPQTPGTWQP